VSPEAKKKAADAKARADEAFNRKDFATAIDTYTQVPISLIDLNSQLYPFLSKILAKGKKKKDNDERK